VLDETLLGILACPIDKGPLLYCPEDGFLYNPRLRQAYPVESGVPIMLPGTAIRVPEDQHARLTGQTAGRADQTAGQAAATQPERAATGIAVPDDEGHR
jgi:uncharacterized protein YbaR (Trm112 family)